MNQKKETRKVEDTGLSQVEDEAARSMAAVFDFEISVEELGLWIAV